MPKEAELPTLAPGWIHMMTTAHTFTHSAEGYALLFEPGTPVPVPRNLQAACLASGAIAVNGTPVYDAKEDPKTKQDPASPDYQDMVRVAAEELLALNVTTDFQGNGKPYTEAWERVLGFKPERATRDKIWAEVRDAAVAAAKG